MLAVYWSQELVKSELLFSDSSRDSGNISSNRNRCSLNLIDGDRFQFFKTNDLELTSFEI